jgi:aminomethyltransferase
VMARDRGHVNRLLVGLRADGPAPLATGAKVMQGDVEVGQVTSSTFSPRLNQAVALAYLKRGAWDAGTAVTVAPEGRAAVVSALPFVAPVA